MAYVIVSVSDTVKLVKPKHWWSDSLSAKSIMAALSEIGLRTEIKGVSNVRTAMSNLVVVIVAKPVN